MSPLKLNRRHRDVFDIDWTQWRALVITAIRVDLRASGGAVPRRATTSALGALAGVVVFHGIVGLAFAGLAYWIADVLLSSALMLTYVSFAILLSVIVDYHSVVTSPDDYAVLGFRPIASRTYFAARLTNLLLFTGLITSALAIAPIAAYGLRGGFALAAAATAAAAGTAFTTAMAGVIVYTWLVNRIGTDRLNRVLTYVQLAMSMVTYSAFVLVPTLLGRSSVVDITLPRTPWLHAHPAVWFARYLEIARGMWGAEQLVPAAASLALMMALVRVAGGRLSLEYAGRLGELSVAAAPSSKRSPARPSKRWWFTNDEDHAIAVLVRAQFRYDQKFRLAVLAILPLTVFYLLLAAREHTLADPFRGGEAAHPGALYYGVFLFPILLHVNLTRSDSYLAAWIFYASPTSPAALVRALKDYLVTRIIVPYLVLLAGVFAWYYDVWWHVVVHTGVLMLFAHLVLIFAVLIDPELPFARPIRQGERTGHMFLTFGVAAAVGSGALPFIAVWVYPSGSRIVWLFAILIAFNATLDVLLRVRLRRLVERAEFVG